MSTFFLPFAFNNFRASLSIAETFRKVSAEPWAALYYAEFEVLEDNPEIQKFLYGKKANMNHC